MKEKKKPLFKKLMASAGGAGFTLVMLAIFLTPVIPLTIGKSTGYYPALMEILGQCPESSVALGANPRAASLGLNTGSCSGDSTSDWSASGRMPVKGDKASGTLRYSLSKGGTTLKLHAVQLSVGGKDIDVARCYLKQGLGGATEDPPQPKVRAE